MEKTALNSPIFEDSISLKLRIKILGFLPNGAILITANFSDQVRAVNPSQNIHKNIEMVYKFKNKIYSALISSQAKGK